MIGIRGTEGRESGVKRGTGGNITVGLHNRSCTYLYVRPIVLEEQLIAKRHT